MGAPEEEIPNLRVLVPSDTTTIPSLLSIRQVL